MAYNLVLDTKFNPFTYDEMIKPVEAATQAHQALEDQYADYQQKANIWKRLADEQRDSTVYRIYKAYAEDLQSQADQLAREGLNPLSRRQFTNMRTRYSQDIVPIEEAYRRRETLAEEQRKLLGQDQSLRFERDARTMSLDDFYKNPGLDYGRSYSGNALRAQVSNMAKAYKEQITSISKLQKLGLPYQYQQFIQEGRTPTEVLAAIQRDAEYGDSEAIDALIRIVDQAMESAGIEDWAPRGTATYDELRSYAEEGLFDAIGKQSRQTFTDSYSANVAAAVATQRAKDLQDAARDRSLSIRSHSLVSAGTRKEVTSRANELANALGLRPSLNGGFTRVYANQSSYNTANSSLMSRILNSLKNSGNTTTGDANSNSNISYRFENGDGTFYLFTRGNNLMTKEAVVAQGTTATEKEFLSQYYDNIHSLWEKNYGRDSNGHLNAGYLSQQLRAERAALDLDSSPHGVLGIEIDFGASENRDILKKMLATAEGPGGEQSKIVKLPKFDNTGTIEKGEVFSGDIDDDSHPLFYATGVPNIGGVIMKYKGDHYLIPYEVLGVQQDATIDVQTLTELRNMREELLNQWGDAYYSSEEGKKLEQDIDNAGGSVIRSIGAGLSGYYERRKESID